MPLTDERLHLQRWLSARPALGIAALVLLLTGALWIASWLLAPYALPEASFEDIRDAQERASSIFLVVLPVCALVGVALPRRPALHHVLLFVCFVLGASIYFPYTNDDSLIFSRYARHLAAGDGLVFNVGERVEGITSLAWVAILAFLMRIGAHPVLAGKLLGDVLMFASASLLYRIVHRATRDRRAAFLTALMLVCDQHLLSWAGSGMDVSIFVFWILAFTASLQHDDRCAITWRTIAVAVVGWYVRPEAALFIAVGLLWLWARSPQPKSELPRLTLVGLAFVLLVAGRWFYFERLVPNTYVAKSAMQLNDPLPWFRQVIAYWTVPFLGIGVAGLWGVRARLGWLIPVFLVMVAHFYRAGGDVLSIRFSLFVLPPLMIGVGQVLAAIDGRARGNGLAALLVAGALLSPALGRLYDVRGEVEGEVAHTYVPGNATVSYQVDYHAAEYVRAHSGPDDLLVADNIGVIGYYGEIRMLDTYGLTSRSVADRYASGERVELSAEIAALRPRWILSNPAGWMWAAAELPQYTRGDYVQVGRWDSFGWSRILLERQTP